MALELIKSTNYGIDATYHKIVQVNINWHTRESLVELHSFIDQTRRESGAHLIASQSFYWSGDEFPFDFDQNNVQTAYTKIKTLDEWLNSVDV